VGKEIVTLANQISQYAAALSAAAYFFPRLTFIKERD
jgi:hypothetical protein